MGYMKIENLYRNRDLLVQEKQLYALEKIHGTSAHLSFKDGKVTFFSGGATHSEFVKLFDEADLLARVAGGFGMPQEFVVYGEAYGGKMQRMSDVYGKELKFVAFDVRVGVNPSHGEGWQSVEAAEQIVRALGLEFVHYEIVDATVEAVDAARDKPSTQAKRNGCGDLRVGEGIVLRPLTEKVDRRGNRMIVKHKTDSFREVRTARKLDEVELLALQDANEIAEEWVTDMRLEHVMDKLRAAGSALGIEQTGDVIRAMLADIEVEASGEFEQTKATKRAIGFKTAHMYKALVTKGEA